MKHLLFTLISLTFILKLVSQDTAAVHYAKTITAADLSRHLHEIASDEYEGRESGRKGEKMCEAYMVNHYRSIGLPPLKGAYTQEFELNLNDPEKVYVRKQGYEARFLEDFYYYPATSDRIIEADLLWGAYGISAEKYEDIQANQIKDKIVLITEGEPFRGGKSKVTGTSEASEWVSNPDKKAQWMEENGAAALIIIHMDYAQRRDRVRDYFTHKGMSLKSDQKKTKQNMPVFHISEEMAEQLIGIKDYRKHRKCLSKGIYKPQTHGQLTLEFARQSETLISSNVMGYIEGSDLAEEVIVLTAHYDHIGVEGEEVYNGADDDGSGTVALMEIAEAFAKAKSEGHGPRRSILVLNVSAEEKGLLGSRYYSENPVLALENTVANLNIDMIGRVDPQHEGNDNYLYLIGADRLSQDLHDVGEQVNDVYTGLELDYTFNAEDDPNRFYYRSDHYNFAKHNVPAVFYFSGVHEDYHQTSDTVDKIMFPRLTKITRYVFHTAWELANREERIRLNAR